MSIDYIQDGRFVVDPTDVLRHLIARKILTPRDMMDGDIRVTPVCRRNNNFRVEVDGRPAYMVKWPSGLDTWKTLAREAATYHQLDDLPEDTNRPLWPKLRDYDGDKHVVILNY